MGLPGIRPGRTVPRPWVGRHVIGLAWLRASELAVLGFARARDWSACDSSGAERGSLVPSTPVRAPGVPPPRAHRDALRRVDRGGGSRPRRVWLPGDLAAPAGR